MHFAAARSAQFLPWEFESARRGKLATDNLRQMLMRRLKGELGVHAQTLLCAAGALAGFAAQNAALEQGEILARRRDLVAPRSLILFTTPKGQRYLFGSWVNAPLLAGYGHAAPLQRFLTEAGERAGMGPSDAPDFKALEARLSAGVTGSGFGVLKAPRGHAPAAQPAELLRALWPQARRIITAPMPRQIPDEPALSEAHWPGLLSSLAGRLVSLTSDKLNPRIGMTLVMESAIIASRLDPDSIDPGRWEVAATRGGLSVTRRGHQRLASA
jgi:hypothetical protein